MTFTDENSQNTFIFFNMWYVITDDNIIFCKEINIKRKELTFYSRLISYNIVYENLPIFFNLRFITWYTNGPSKRTTVKHINIINTSWDVTPKSIYAGRLLCSLSA